MSKLTFNSNSRPTVGIELELGLVDGQTMELSSSIEAVLAELPDDAGASFKPELMQSVVEINTGVCTTIDEANRAPRSAWRRWVPSSNETVSHASQRTARPATRSATVAVSISVGRIGRAHGVPVCALW